jgi:Lhr-like helicase
MSMAQTSYEIFLSKYGSFTDIQEAAFKTIESGENCVISAPTGSG